MIDQRHIPEGQVPFITALAPRGRNSESHYDFDAIRYRMSSFYAYSTVRPFVSFTGSGA